MLVNHRNRSMLALVALVIGLNVCAHAAPGDSQTPATSHASEITLKGSMLCNGACLHDPKKDDHVLAIYAIDGTAEVRAEVARVMKECYPQTGLDADAAQKLLDEFSAGLKYYISPDSPALKDPKYQQKSHYCQPAQAVAVTGTVALKDGNQWITASRIEPATLNYPQQMYAPDRPFAKNDREPVILKVSDKITLKCVYVPPGKFLMGTPQYMWPFYVEEYPHAVTLTKPYYLAEIPVTQEMFEAVMRSNPSPAKGGQLPVANPRFADIEKFCRILSEKNGRRVRLPSDAEWEYAARVGTSNPSFPRKYKDQNSSGAEGLQGPAAGQEQAAQCLGALRHGQLLVGNHRRQRHVQCPPQRDRSALSPAARGRPQPPPAQRTRHRQ